MNFTNIEELNKEFRSGNVTVPDQIMIGDIQFNYLSSSKTDFRQLLTGATAGAAVYTVKAKHREQLEEAGLQEWIVMAYKINELRVHPVKVFPTTKARHSFKLNLSEESRLSEEDGKKPSNEREVLGDFAEVRFVNLPSSSFVKGKVDTGATISSLHCDGHKIDQEKGMITFKCSLLSSNNITLPLTDMQAVKNADNVENRPVISMNIRIGDKVLNDIKFNLNDRSKMDSPILIGQNILTAGKYLIDPQVQEEVDWDNVFKTVEEILEEEPLEEGLSSLGRALMARAADAPPLTPEQEYALAHRHDVPRDRQGNVMDGATQELDKVFQATRGSTISIGQLLDYAKHYGDDD